MSGLVVSGTVGFQDLNTCFDSLPFFKRVRQHRWMVGTKRIFTQSPDVDTFEKIYTHVRVRPTV